MFTKKPDEMIGIRLATLRNSQELTQSVMAAATDVSDATYKNYERSRRDPPTRFIQAVCTQFEVNVAWLIEGRGEMYLEKPDGT